MTNIDKSSATVAKERAAADKASDDSKPAEEKTNDNSQKEANK